MKESSNCFKDYKKLTVEFITTGANTTAYQIKETQGAEYGVEAEKIRSAFDSAVKALPLTIHEVIERHFKNEKTRFFHQSDAHKNIEGDAYIRYEYNGIAVQIWVGGDSGEVCVLNSATPAIVDRLLTIVQFNK
jgi:hypothetical protein